MSVSDARREGQKSRPGGGSAIRASRRVLAIHSREMHRDSDMRSARAASLLSKAGFIAVPRTARRLPARAHLRLGEHAQPLDLHDDSLLDESVLGEDSAQLRRLPRVAAGGARWAVAEREERFAASAPKKESSS